MAKSPSVDGETLRERFAIIKELADVYRPERLTYLVICALSTGALLASIIILLVNQKLDAKLGLGLFGSTGVVTASVGLSLKMWNDSLRQVFG